MITTRYIDVAFGGARSAMARALYQYDYGQILELEGFGLPSAFQVDFSVDPDGGNAVHVTVAPDQYSLAIGKRGQNVRLTTRLTGWHVEIRKSMATASFEDQKAEAIKELAETLSISTSVATQMADAGFLSVDGIVSEDEVGFIASTGLDEVTAKGIYAAAAAVAELTAGGDAE